MALATLDSEALVSLEADLRAAILDDRPPTSSVLQPSAGTNVFGTLDQFYEAVQKELQRRSKNIS